MNIYMKDTSFVWKMFYCLNVSVYNTFPNSYKNIPHEGPSDIYIEYL